MFVFLRYLVVAIVSLAAAPSSFAEATAEEFATALVEIEVTIDEGGRTVPMLGSQRSGSGAVIDANGLIVTVGYLVLEASEISVTYVTGQRLSASVVAVDEVSGLALLRSVPLQGQSPPPVTPLRIGDSSAVAIGDSMLALPAGGLDSAAGISIEGVREFSAPWEYLLDSAIFTAPPIRNFSGAALINRDAELIGIGNLALDNINESANGSVGGNVFIPINQLTSRLGKLLTGNDEPRAGRAWLGMMVDRQLSVTRVLSGSPAEMAGIKAGDTVLGVNDNHVSSRAEIFRTLWSTTKAGDKAKMLLARERKIKTVDVVAGARSEWLTHTR